MLFIETGFNHGTVKFALDYPSRWSPDRQYADHLEKGYAKEKRGHWKKFEEEEKARASEARIANGCHVRKT